VLFVEQRFEAAHHIGETPAQREFCTVDMVGAVD
jgi:hypothetical protein